MIKMISAYTEEVDEVEDGISEILNQVNPGSLLKNSVGLVTCHFDFTNSGFIKELRKKLAFDIIGMTTLASANQYGKSMYALSLTVLTSDDVIFETGMTGSLGSEEYEKEIEAVYKDIAGKNESKPSFILTFFPFIREVSGALLHKSFDTVCGGIPFWGSLATNVDASFERCHTFLNGEICKDALGMVLMHGPVDPEFIVVSMPTQNIRKNRGQITSSDGCVLKEINGIPPLKYLESLGIVIMKDVPNVSPLMVYYEGSTEPVALAVYSVHDDGSFLCGGEMPLGASIAVGEITQDSILSSAGEGVDRVLKTGKKSGAMFFPCVSRYLMLSPNQNVELELVTKKMENIMPFMVAYSGGEICPILNEEGIAKNRFHNYSFIACVF